MLLCFSLYIYFVSISFVQLEVTLGVTATGLKVEESQDSQLQKSKPNHKLDNFETYKRESK